MGRRSGGGGGGNAWNDFQRAHGGQGLSRGEMSAMYHGTSAATSSSFASSASAPGQSSSSSAWNNFQHNYGGRGLSKQDLKQLYAHHKGDGPAASTSVRPASSTTTTTMVSSAKPAVNWNEFQRQYAGTSLSRQQVAHLYHAQQQQSQQQSEPVAQCAQQKHVSFDTGSNAVTRYPSSGTTAPTPISMASVNPYPAAPPFAYYPPAAPVYTAVFGSNPHAYAAGSYNESDQEQFHAVGSKEMEDDMVFFKYSVDSRGHDRSPEELAFKYYRHRVAKANAEAKAKSVASVASAKALFVASLGTETAEKKASTVVVKSSTAHVDQPLDEPKMKIELSVVQEGDPEVVGQEDTKVSTEEEEDENTTAKPQPETKYAVEASHAEAGDGNKDETVVSSAEEVTKLEPRETKPEDAAKSLGLVISEATSPIATGLTGPVVKATIDNGATEVAVKIIPNLCSKRARSQLATELEMLVTLPSHPHLVKIYGSVLLKDGAQVGVVAEFEPASEPLATRLYRSSSISSISEKTKHTWILQLLDALEHLHTHGITHRDLSPKHVLLSPTTINKKGDTDDSVQSLKLIDFGLPTLKNAAAGASAGGDKARGFDPAYASPELLGGELPRHDVDGWKKSDVFSVTVLIMELLLEEPPWEGELPVFFTKAVAERGERAFKVNDLCVDGKKSRVLTGIITQAWHQDPDKRPTVSVLRAMIAKVFYPDDHD